MQLLLKVRTHNSWSFSWTKWLFKYFIVTLVLWFASRHILSRCIFSIFIIIHKSMVLSFTFAKVIWSWFGVNTNADVSNCWSRSKHRNNNTNGNLSKCWHGQTLSAEKKNVHSYSFASNRMFHLSKIFQLIFFQSFLFYLLTIFQNISFSCM